MDRNNGLSRREWLGMGVAAAGLPAGLIWAAEQAAAEPTTPNAGRQRAGRHEHPKNIIFMVPDGMSTGVPSLAEPFSQLVRSKDTNWCELMRDPRTSRGLVEMGSLDSLVTDSAAASTSWSSGTRVFNGALNVLPDGTRLTPIAGLFRGAGRKVGLVTTTTMAHATPAGFATVHPDRNAYEEIAPQYLGVVDVLMGGGIEQFEQNLRSDNLDLIGTYRKAGYTIWNHRDQVLTGKHQGKVLGLFHQGHLPYTIDHINDAKLTARVPTLAEMSRTALDSLQGSPNGFLLQIEGGRVDHAAHANDAAAILWDQLAFDDAMGVVLDFQRNHPDTLLVIMSDHGNANPGLNGMGPRYSESTACFERIARAKASFEMMSPRLKALSRSGGSPSVSEVIELLKANTGLELTRREADGVGQYVAGSERPFEMNKLHRNLVGMLGEALGNHNGIGWTGIAHTADLVISMAVGPGQQAFNQLLRNVDVHALLIGFAGVSHRNPHLSPKQAARYMGESTASLVK